MSEAVQPVPCLICEAEDAAVLFRGVGLAEVVRCRRDGLVYLSPRPANSFIRELRGNFVRDDNLRLFDKYRRVMLRREASAIKKVKTRGRLLDIGCATGTFFENFTEGDWQLFGVDTSPLGVERARTKFGAEIFCGTLADAHYPSGSFDLVTMLDTIYYVPDPVHELKEIRRILKDDGILAIEIPGLTYTLLREQGPLCWLFDRKWRRGLANSLHLYFFSPQTIQSVLALSGFTVFQMFPEQASMAGGFVQRALNKIHFDIARLLFVASRHKFSIAGKEFYLAKKAVRLVSPSSANLGSSDT